MLFDFTRSRLIVHATAIRMISGECSHFKTDCDATGRRRLRADSWISRDQEAGPARARPAGRAQKPERTVCASWPSAKGFSAFQPPLSSTQHLRAPRGEPVCAGNATSEPRSEFGGEREMKVLERFSELGQEGHTLAMLLLRLGRGRLGH